MVKCPMQSCEFANSGFANYTRQMAPRRRLFAGSQLRKIRSDRNLLQAELARSLGISTSYLSQLENDDRPLSAKIIERLAELYPIDWQDFAVDQTEHLANALREAVSDPVYGEPFPTDTLAKLAEQQPAFARRFVELHERFQRANQRLEMVDEAFSADNSTGSRLPWEEVRDWFHLADNYIDSLDRSAEQLAESFRTDKHRVSGSSMQSHLARAHKVEVVFEQASSLRLYDESRRILTIATNQSPTGIRFQLAYQIAAMTLGETIEKIAASADLRSSTSRELLKVGLANYAAGAVLMPYEDFRRSARALRHDVDHLANEFQTSFEQACHRLSTLQREGSRGLPVFFCRVDMAGNITKRHSATRLQFARFGGACPLWIVHEAVAIPDRVLVQLAETPDGVRYVSMARGLVKASGRFDRVPRRYAVALGFEIQHANEFVYADGIDVASEAGITPIGVSCRICPRSDCEQRAFPPSDQEIRVNLFSRGVVPYQLET